MTNQEITHEEIGQRWRMHQVKLAVAAYRESVERDWRDFREEVEKARKLLEEEP